MTVIISNTDYVIYLLLEVSNVSLNIIYSHDIYSHAASSLSLRRHAHGTLANRTVHVCF